MESCGKTYFARVKRLRLITNASLPAVITIVFTILVLWDVKIYESFENDNI